MAAFGRRLFGAGTVALGLEGLFWGDFAGPWQPVPQGFPCYVPLAYATALALIAGGVGLQLRRSARPAGLFLGAVFGVFAFIWAERTVRAPGVVAMWSGCAEAAVLVLGAVLAGGAAGRRVTQREAWSAKSARVWLGLCLLAFGAAHFTYIRETAAMAPSWIPPDAVTWAYVTGAAHAVAGLALLTDVFAIAAAWSLTVMFAIFEALVWLPTLVTTPEAAMSWRGSSINLCLVASALFVAALLTEQVSTATVADKERRS